MNLTIPSSGFCVIADKKRNLSKIKHTFESNNAETFLFDEDNILIASWKENSDHGLWSDGVHTIAYDMDLSNQDQLSELLGISNDNAASNDESPDKGYLIWLLYQKYGKNFADKLRGTFAFALWDGPNKNLYILTDPYGLKPVVYSEHDNGLYAASRIKQLLWADPSLTKINPDAIFHYLFFQAVCSPLTIYKNIKKLKPGNGLLKTKQDLNQFLYYDEAV